MERTWKLFFMYLNSGFRRLRFDLVRELIVLICASLLGATFYYIFNDFVNQHMGRLNPELRQWTLQVASWLLLLFVALWQAGKVSEYLFNPNGIAGLASRLGESKTKIVLASCLSLGFFLALTSGLTWLLVQSSLYPRSPLLLIQTQLVLWLAVGIVALLRKNQIQNHKSRRGLNMNQSKGLVATMVQWRLLQIVLRNRAAQFALVSGVFCTGLAVYFVSKNTPYAALFFLCYLLGFFSSLPVFFQLASDIKVAWAERSMGISHDMVIHVYRILAYILVAPLLIIFFLSALMVQLELMKILQLVAIAFTPAYLAPVLMFQIDAHRPVIQILTVFFVGLFIATAIFVHLLGVILLPGFAYYALASQQGRFYRV